VRNLFITIAALLVLPSHLVVAQELEPRRWSHLPIGANFLGFGYVYTDTDIFVNPTLQLENVRADIHSTAISYVRAVELFSKSARVDVLLPYSVGRWEGLLEGEPASTRRSGFNDPKVRFALNLLGSPAQRGADFRQFEVNTIVGAAVEITMPLGEYQDDKLINLGTNRWTIRPQIGVVHNWDKWAAELTTSAWFFTDNDEFSGNKTREQNPLLAVQSHVIYTFRPGFWASVSAAYGGGARSTIDGIEADDEIGKFLWAASFGFPISRQQGVKIAYMAGETTENTGNDYKRLIFAYSMMWGGN
jgi:hypothetical protein